MVLKQKREVAERVQVVGSVVRKKFALLFSFTLILVIGITMNSLQKEKTTSTFCFNFPWRNLHPGTQNTLVGGLIISQQFESLVKIDTNGNVVPSLAKSWKISDDFKKIHFKLDEDKRFINGKQVKSIDVLTSWEKSLAMSKEGPNNSLKDVLYSLEGVGQFTGLRNISGFKILNDFEFELNFKSPFRLAIYHLRGARFAVYSESSGTIVGSGRYKYDVNSSSDSISLIDNQNEHDFNIILKPKGDVAELISEGVCDIAYAPQGVLPRNLVDFPDVEYVESEDAVHLVLTLNTKKGIFSDVKMRRAFLYLINQSREIANSFVGNNSLNSADPQIYNVFAQGRLDEEEAIRIISEGSKWVDIFKTQVTKNDLSFLINDASFLKNAFDKIALSSSLKIVNGDSSMITKATYSGSLEQDFTAGFISVLSYDPDGIYHALGRHGAILNPYIANEKIFNLLEEGRAITDREKLDGFYQEVSRVFLREVPFIHLGFSRNVLFYNKQKISVSKDAFRNTLDFSSFSER